jgi:multicomponent Na+:H+ antiporter subunit E
MSPRNDRDSFFSVLYPVSHMLYLMVVMAQLSSLTCGGNDMHDKPTDRIKAYAIPFTLLFLFWVILSPDFSEQAVFLGLIISAFIVVYSRDLLFTTKEMPLYQFRHFWNMLQFMGILLVEIVKANIDVAKIVLSPSLPIQPHFIEVPMMLKNDINKVIYGNAVTLTPGTLTIDITDECFVIHALTDEAAEAMKGSFIEKWVVRQEERP